MEGHVAGVLPAVGAVSEHTQPGQNLVLRVRVADPVHLCPDPDPASQNFKNPVRSLLALAKNQFKHQIFFRINQISSDI